MPSLISRTTVLVGDPWVRHAATDVAPAGSFEPGAAVCDEVHGDAVARAGLCGGDGDLLVSLAVWQAMRTYLLDRPGRLGVELEPADDPALLAPDLDHLALIVVQFPVVTDGRGYSTARLLRERHGWRRELRACGPFTRDALFYLARCGFDSFELREGEDAQAALAEFSAFDEAYQAAADRGPLFERRLGAQPAA
jgi:uncharacterized protein (DUF934 family)